MTQQEIDALRDSGTFLTPKERLELFALAEEALRLREERPRATGEQMNQCALLKELDKVSAENVELILEITRLREENARLKADAERLDWLEKRGRDHVQREFDHECGWVADSDGSAVFEGCYGTGPYEYCHRSIREAIDAARAKEPPCENAK